MPGQYLGYTDDGDFFFFDVDTFLDGEIVVEEVYPGVTATAAGACTGKLSGQSGTVEIQAIVASMNFEGATHHVLVALWEIDTPLDEGTWGWMYSLLEASGGAQAAGGGNPCSDGIDGDCMFVCPDIFCADGTQFCPLCDPLLLEAACEIHANAIECQTEALHDSNVRSVVASLGLVILAASCLVASGGFGVVLCYGGLAAATPGLWGTQMQYFEDMAHCQEVRETRV